MNNLLQQCNELIEQLNHFSEAIISLGQPVTGTCVEDFERKTGFNLPFDFKYIIKKFNGFTLSGTEVYSIGEEMRLSLNTIYQFEHHIIENPMPESYLPFSPDGFGNHYCLNLGKIDDGLCPVIFWQHDYVYSNFSEVEQTHTSFANWITEVMIEWTLENYNYDGTEK
jgi:hypothetical protein